MSIEAQTLKSFRIKLETKFTNGHDFCDLIVDETNYNFTARLYGGESYTYSWGAPGDDFIQFLIDTFSKFNDYLFEKLADYSYSNLVDTEKTAQKMREKVLVARYNRELNEEDARELWEEIESLEQSTNLTTEHFYDMYRNKFEIGIENNIWSDEPWFEDFIEFQEDYKCRIFCDKVAPILAEVLKQEYRKS